MDLLGRNGSQTAPRIFYNNNIPNLEDTAEVFVGKGFTADNRFRVDLSTTGLATQVESYLLRSQNQVFVSNHVRRNTSISDEIVRKYQELSDGPDLVSSGA